jgi:hypothetical protein
MPSAEPYNLLQQDDNRAHHKVKRAQTIGRNIRRTGKLEDRQKNEQKTAQNKN